MNDNLPDCDDVPKNDDLLSMIMGISIFYILPMICDMGLIKLFNMYSDKADKLPKEMIYLECFVPVINILSMFIMIVVDLIKFIIIPLVDKIAQ
jgi:hypothetical protein